MEHDNVLALDLQKCYLVHPDNIEHTKRHLPVRVAVIARPDAHLATHRARQIIIETARGVHTRCYLSEHNGVCFLIVYGRFDRVRSTSSDIDFELTQEALSFLGIRVIVGHVVAGSILASAAAGSVYIPHDLIGFGGYNKSRKKLTGFRNVDSFVPFCPVIRAALVASSRQASFPVHSEGVYASFHGYPRIETAAELRFYEGVGCHLVGQTLDPEATLAREAGCHYAAVAATIDDHTLRGRFLANDLTARDEIDRNISLGRERMFEVFLHALPQLDALSSFGCNCELQGALVAGRSRHFYYRPEATLVED